jgi:2-polyprenyl-3-methyl-5-hydroxy-6-metoxy-1,4-benzoquinol methylase
MPEKGIKTYSEYNYLRPGIASFLRTRHFEHALRLTKNYFHKCNVIDFGCGDGPFLPSLARYFNYVAGIDMSPKFVEFASKVVSVTGLRNVEVICNCDLTMHHLESELAKRKYHILFLLETLEHVGDKSNLWESRVNFVKELFDLIDERGIIIISVPNMVGIPFLLQRLGFFLLGANREPISKTNLLRASFFDDTTDLEREWQAGHLDFNHKKLEGHLRKEVHILKRKYTFSNHIRLPEEQRQWLRF